MENHFKYRYLMGAMQQNVLSTTVRMMCIAEESDRIKEILAAWQSASVRMTKLAETEAGLPDRIRIEEPPQSIVDRLKDIIQDRLFAASFSAMPISFNIIDTDNLVAPQREVNLDYVESLIKRIPGKQIEDIVEYCVGPRTEPPDLKLLQTAQNQMTYSSRSLDLRFLGGSPKPIGEDDIAVAHMGGQPVEVVSLLVGFGAAPINTFQVGSRLVLNNGFHRVVALRMAGITKIPVVVQHVANPEIEFPEQILGLSRAYLLQHPRPVLIRDFFDNALTVELRLKQRRKIVKVTWGVEDSVVPD
jgi:hypothetical protein